MDKLLITRAECDTTPATPPLSTQVEEIDPYYGDAVELATSELADALPKIVGAGTALDIQAGPDRAVGHPEDAPTGSCPTADREPDVVLTAGTA